ncbi:Modification methylase MthTI [uncultured archaeon]|nr:Modification methylase MthTI [uncultured archaeon]
MQNRELTAIDLFSGMGGLTFGLKKAGFKVLAAVEVDNPSAETYRANNSEVELFVEDIRKLTAEKIFEKIGIQKIDLIAGCPPCQGFCKLTEKYKKEDPRNTLALEMIRLIEEIDPTMVMLENVPGLAAKGHIIFDEFTLRLEKMGYVINKAVLQLADYGIPQSRKRLVLLAGKGFKVELPKQTHSRKGNSKLKLKKWATLKDALKNCNSKKVVTLSEAVKNGGAKKLKWNVVRDMSPANIKRLKALSEGANRTAIPTKLRPVCHMKGNKGFQNVYGRLAWDETPPTMTGGCTTLSKGRFGHPEELRTISVREAALIQTFPKSYKINTEFMEPACTMVGNALPPKFAKLVAKACIQAYSSVF